jgi:hypothetical protein
MTAEPSICKEGRRARQQRGKTGSVDSEIAANSSDEGTPEGSGEDFGVGPLSCAGETGAAASSDLRNVYPGAEVKGSASGSSARSNAPHKGLSATRRKTKRSLKPHEVRTHLCADDFFDESSHESAQEHKSPAEKGIEPMPEPKTMGNSPKEQPGVPTSAPVKVKKARPVSAGVPSRRAKGDDMDGEAQGREVTRRSSEFDVDGEATGPNLAHSKAASAKAPAPATVATPIAGKQAKKKAKAKVKSQTKAGEAGEPAGAEPTVSPATIGAVAKLDDFSLD